MSEVHSAPQTKASSISFDTATQRLEEIIRLMDDPDTSLEDMIALVEEGTKLKKACVTILQQAELRIQQLEAPTAVATPAPSRASTPTQQAATASSTQSQDHDFTLL